MENIKGGAPMEITMDNIKDAKQVTCDCGGAMFTEKMMFKRISSFISPTGKEELYPVQVIVCDACGKVPRALNPYDMVAEEYLAVKKIIE
jgi:hypothetical protein